MAERTEEQIEKKVPALVVSGFLGSGKTTLIRNLLDQAVADGVRVALVSNELGELGIDRALLGRGGEAFVEIEGGCVCCELSDDLLETLEMLWQKVRPDRVVIETSGVALPFDTQLNFWRDPVRRWMGDDMAVVVVNAEQLVEGRDLAGTFTDQVTSADLLVLNKVDLIDAGQLERAESRLRAIEPEAPLVACSQGRVPPDLLFPPDPGEMDRSGEAPGARAHHHEDFVTEEWRPPSGMTPDALCDALSQEGLLRAKGFVETSEGVRIVQVVGRRIELTEPDAAPAEDLVGRVVLIRRATAERR
jgi:cobalamin biosynthesis protein CobW